MKSELQEIRQAFAAEAEEMLAEVERALLLLEAHPDDADEFNRLFRGIHTLKGSAGIVGFTFLEQFCHDVEYLLARIREGELSLTPPVVSLLLQCHDHIRNMTNGYLDSGIRAYSPPPVHQQLLDSLKAQQGDPLADAPGSDGAGQDNSGSPEAENALDDPTVAGKPGNGDLFSGSSALQGGRDAGQGVAAPRAATAAHKTVRVDKVKLDQLLDLVVELVTAASVMEADTRRLGDSSAMESSSLVSSLAKQVQEKSMSFRMAPVSTLFRRFQRVVQDSARETGKQIRLDISGGDTELEKIVAEKLGEPLLHLVRNAVDHGIELPEEREKAGKSPQAVIRLHAFQDAGHVVMEVIDDGQGMDRDRIMAKALSRGLIKPGVEPSDRELLNIICEPGFSILEQATMLSGRGVGMDSVKMAIESLRGRIELETCKGSGTTVRIRIPLSLSVIDGFMVAVGGTNYIVPMELVLETLEAGKAELDSLQARGYIKLRETLLPCVSLRDIFKVHGGEAASGGTHILVVRHASGSIGLVVDRFQGETKAVIKPLGRLYRHVSYVSGATILSDGSIALLLETEMLAEQHESKSKL